MEMKNYIDALRVGKGYDWICLYGHELSKAELCNIIKELDYEINDHMRFDSRYEVSNESQEMYDNVADALEEVYGE